MLPEEINTPFTSTGERTSINFAVQGQASRWTKRNHVNKSRAPPHRVRSSLGYFSPVAGLPELTCDPRMLRILPQSTKDQIGSPVTSNSQIDITSPPQ